MKCLSGGKVALIYCGLVALTFTVRHLHYTHYPHPRVNPPNFAFCGCITGSADGADNESAEKHAVTMVKEAGQALGFSIRGGSEHGLGIYVSELDEGSPAGISNTCTLISDRLKKFKNCGPETVNQVFGNFT